MASGRFESSIGMASGRFELISSNLASQITNACYKVTQQIADAANLREESMRRSGRNPRTNPEETEPGHESDETEFLWQPTANLQWLYDYSLGP